MLNQQISKQKKEFLRTTLKPLPVPYKNGSENQKREVLFQRRAVDDEPMLGHLL